jgi:L-ascorbate metabolism protein UlaG (beta-lactamase superfamily)
MNAGPIGTHPALQLGPASGDAPEVGELTWIGTATVLLRCAGFTILTDPNFLHQGQHAKLGYGLRSERLTEPAMTIAQLPALDLVVLSHHHGDHFDEVAAAELDRKLPILTTPHAARKLRRQGFTNPVALETWESQEVLRGDARVRVTAMPGKHAPQPLDALLPSVMGSILDFTAADGRSLRVYITGDTLLHEALEEIPRRYPDIDLGLIHLGGTRVLGVLVTMDADQGVRALQLVRPKVAVPIHHGDYTVFKDPLDSFRKAAGTAAVATDIHYLERGETFRIPFPTPEQAAP